MDLKVKDLFEGAYLLCSGFHLKELTVKDFHGKPKVMFIISGEGIEEKSESYRTGQATVNVAMLKFTMEKLKDAMFTEIRKETKGKRDSHDHNRKYQKVN